MPSAIETLHPGVYVVEVDGRPRVVGVSVNTCGFVGVAEKGSVNRSVLVVNTTQFKDRFGETFRGSYLEPCVRYFFEQGGQRVFIARVVGDGAAVSWTNAKNVSDSGGRAKVVAGVAGPYNLAVGEHLDVEVSGYALQVFTIAGTQAVTLGNAFTGAALNGLTLQIQFAGWDATTITFAGLPPIATPTDVANFINPLIQGGACVVNGANVDFKADQVGSGSYVDITGGSALVPLGFNIYKTYGTGNLPNVDEATAQDVAMALASLQGAVASETPNGKLQILTIEKGTAVSVQIALTTTTLAFSFDNFVHAGWGYSGSAAQTITSKVENFNLAAGQVLAVDVVGNPTQSFTFTGTQAILTGAAFVSSNINSLTLQIQFSGYDASNITFTGLPVLPTIQEVIDYIQSRIRGGEIEELPAGQLHFKADQYGNGSSIQIIGGSALSALGLVVSGSSGTGNVANVDKVTAAEVVAVVMATAADFVAEATTNGGLRLYSVATGDTATIQVNNALTTATGLGFDYALHRGSDADFQDSILFECENPGAWGNNLSLRTISWAQTTRGDVYNGDTEIYVSSLRGMALGDVIYTYDPTFVSTRYVGLITAIDVANTKISVLPMVDDMVGLIPAGSPITSSSQHLMNSRTMADLVDNADRITLSSTAGLKIGARVTICDGTTMVDVSVIAINGNVILFAPVSLASTIVAGAAAVSQEWKLEVLEKNVVKETFDFLSMEENSLDYFGIRLAGDTNESLLVVAVDLMAGPTEMWKRIPQPVVSQPLAYGQDGSTPTDNDYIGHDANPKSGMYLFDDVTDLNFFAIPGITTVTVQAEACAYATNRGNLMVVLDAPRHDDQPMEVYNYRMFELNADTSFAALYYPWVIVRDPVVGNSRIALPPSGHICGQYAATGATRGVHVAPANVVVRGVVDLTYRCSDAEQDILNPVGINAIRWFPGQGIRIWGCRTLTSRFDGRHYVPVRRLLNFIKESVKRGNFWAVFEPNDPRLWRAIEAVNKEFLHSLWLRGMLFPSNNESQAYFVKCDEETNPMSEIKEGRVNCEIGVNPPLPAEFIIFRIGVWDGGTSIAEEIAGRG
jgi:phage tail sheath protein FI